MDWFRWWHGSLTDPKFQSVARKSGQELSRVIALWVAILEHASSVTQCNADVTRGNLKGFDVTDFDVLFKVDDGACAEIYKAFVEKSMIIEGAVARWDERQVKREDDSSKERVAEHRARKKVEELQQKLDAILAENEALKRNVTHGNARLDKSRLDNKTLTPSSNASQFDGFWSAYPRKQGKKDALKAWTKLKPDDALVGQIMDAVDAQKNGWDWQHDEGAYIPHAATWLNGGRWMDEIRSAPAPQPRSEAWWTDIVTMRAKGATFDPPIIDRPGESIVAYKNRIDAAIAGNGAKAGPTPYVPPIPQDGYRSALTPEQQLSRSSELKAALKRRSNGDAAA